MKLKPQLAGVQLALARLLEARGSKTETAKHYPAKAQLPKSGQPRYADEIKHLFSWKPMKASYRLCRWHVNDDVGESVTLKEI